MSTATNRAELPSADSADQTLSEQPLSLAKLSDADLLDAWHRDRQRAALETLVQRYSVMVLSVCRRRCRCQADAEDAFQTTFLYLARNAHKVRQPQRLVGWLHRVAQRAAMATQRTAQRESAPMIEPPVEPDDPLDRLTQRHEAIVLDEELADLPEHYRAAIVMHLYEGQTLQSLAEHFATTVGSIRGRLQRGKQLLAIRLRRRGIVPAIAFASATSWSVSAEQAHAAADTFVGHCLTGDLPNPPIETKVLDSLLLQGPRLMPSLTTAGGLLFGSTLIALTMFTVGDHGHGMAQGTQVEFIAAPADPVPTQQIVGTDAADDIHAQGASVGPTSTTGGANPASGPTPSSGNLVWSQKPRVPEPTSDVAKKLQVEMDRPVELQIAEPLSALPQALTQALGIPVLLDSRGIEYANVDTENATINANGTAMPLRSVLHQMLHPLGLQAVIEDEGLIITADPAALVHKGIGTSQWINLDQQVAESIIEKLSTKAGVDFVELPLGEVVRKLNDEFQLPIIINQRALEEVGLSADEPVSLSVANISLRSMLTLMLRDLDLTYTIRGDVLEITTIDAEESDLLQRIYWLEGTGLARGDQQSVIRAIESTIEPDTWESLGGPSTIASMDMSRPAILVSTTYRVHLEIENLLKVLRESNFSPDPVLEPVQVIAPTMMPGGMGGMGGGMGGMGGGGGFF